jgi:hypothetical protein
VTREKWTNERANQPDPEWNWTPRVIVGVVVCVLWLLVVAAMLIGWITGRVVFT